MKTQDEILIGLDGVRNFLSNIPNIDMGGCGIAALTMYRWLGVNGFEMSNVKFVMGYHHYSDAFKKNFNSYINNDRLCASCTHMGILIQGKKSDITFDSKDRWTFDAYVHTQIVDERYILGSINGSNWNYIFDREKYIPIISNEFGIDLNDISL